MGELPEKSGSVVSLHRRNLKGPVPMNAEEIRINKKLLDEISKKKRERETNVNASSSSLYRHEREEEEE